MLPPSSLVLHNRDLLDTIFEFFECNERQELLWASLTSKAFLEPALNALWREMSSVFPIFRLLPTFNKDNTFTTIVHDEHIQRLLYYTLRIQELSLDFGDIDDYPNLDLDIVFSVFNRAGRAAAFHSLRILRVYAPRMEYTNQLVLFFISTPNLEVLNVRGPLPGIPTANFLYATSSISRNLKSVTLSYITSAKAVIDVLPCFRKLQILELSYMDHHIPRSFLEECASSMTSLQSLTMRFKYRGPRLTEDIGTSMPGGPSVPLTPITFNLLSKLHLKGPPRNVENMLNILHVPQLATLDLLVKSRDGENYPDIRLITQRFLTLNEPYLKDGLRSLCLRGDAFPQMIVNLPDYLDSFRIFTKLDTLHVLNCWVSTSSLANFLRENKPWSKLTFLQLLHPKKANENHLADVLSIAALPLLADSFPNLRCLIITIDHPDQDAMETMAVENLRKAHSLESLYLDRLPRDWIHSKPTAVAFASFLHRLFPGLKTAACGICGDHREWMMDVGEMLKKNKLDEDSNFNVQNGNCNTTELCQ